MSDRSLRNVLIGSTAPLAVVLVLVFAVFSLSTCGKTQGFSKEALDQMGQIVDQSMSRNNIPGVIVGVWIPGRGNWIASMGEADIETGRGIAATDKVRIASNTKTFVATAVLQLADEGRISLDDPLEKYVTGVPNGNQITIRQVLGMTAGIFSFTEDDKFAADFTADPLMQLTPQQELDIALSHPPDFPPGQGWHYSDTNYEILGMIIEKVTGNSIENELQRRIFDPLGLSNTSFPTTPDMPTGSSRGYVLQGNGQPADYTRVDPSVPWAGGAIISNLDDLKIWAKALATGELVSEAAHKEQLQGVAVPGQEKLGTWYGLGILNFAGFLGHTGAIFGYNSVVFYLPEEDATIVVLANKSTNASGESAAIFLDLAQLLFPDNFPSGN